MMMNQLRKIFFNRNEKFTDECDSPINASGNNVGDWSSFVETCTEIKTIAGYIYTKYKSKFEWCGNAYGRFRNSCCELLDVPSKFNNVLGVLYIYGIIQIIYTVLLILKLLIG